MLITFTRTTNYNLNRKWDFPTCSTTIIPFLLLFPGLAVSCVTLKPTKQFYDPPEIGLPCRLYWMTHKIFQELHEIFLFFKTTIKWPFFSLTNDWPVFFPFFCFSSIMILPMAIFPFTFSIQGLTRFPHFPYYEICT